MMQQVEYWFRGKKFNGGWEYGGINDKGDCIVSCHQFIPVDPQTVGMKFPAHDVHSCGIYSGDILLLWVNDKKLLVSVDWDGWKYNYSVHQDSELFELPEDFNISNCRIVGNVWEGITND